MPTTPDDLAGGIADADKLILNNAGLTPDNPGEAIYDGTGVQVRDSVGVFDARYGAPMAANTVRLRDAGTTGNATDKKISALTAHGTPVAGDFVLGETAAGDLCKIDVGDLGGGGGGGGGTESAGILLWGNASVGSTTTDRYLTPGGCENNIAPVAAIEFAVAYAANIKNLRIVQVGAGNGNNLVYTLYVNGVATALTATVASTASGGTDLTHVVLVAAGDELSICVEKASSIGSSPANVMVSVELATLAAASCMLQWGNDSVGSTTTDRYLTPGWENNIAPVSAIEFEVPYAGTAKNLRIVQGTAGNGNTIDYTLCVNGIPSALTVAVASTAASGDDLVNTVAVAAGDVLTLLVEKAAGIGTSPSKITATIEYA